MECRFRSRQGAGVHSLNPAPTTCRRDARTYSAIRITPLVAWKVSPVTRRMYAPGARWPPSTCNGMTAPAAYVAALRQACVVHDRDPPAKRIEQLGLHALCISHHERDSGGINEGVG